jgi:hypothetical protein
MNTPLRLIAGLPESARTDATTGRDPAPLARADRPGTSCSLPLQTSFLQAFKIKSTRVGKPDHALLAILAGVAVRRAGAADAADAAAAARAARAVQPVTAVTAGTADTAATAGRADPDAPDAPVAAGATGAA